MDEYAMALAPIYSRERPADWATVRQYWQWFRPAQSWPDYLTCLTIDGLPRAVFSTLCGALDGRGAVRKFRLAAQAGILKTPTGRRIGKKGEHGRSAVAAMILSSSCELLGRIGEGCEVVAVWRWGVAVAGIVDLKKKAAELLPYPMELTQKVVEV